MSELRNRATLRPYIHHREWSGSVLGPRPARVYPRPTRFCGLGYVQTTWRSYLIDFEHPLQVIAFWIYPKVCFLLSACDIMEAVIESGVSASAPVRRPLYVLLSSCSPCIVRGTDVSRGLTGTSSQSTTNADSNLDQGFHLQNTTCSTDPDSHVWASTWMSLTRK